MKASRRKRRGAFLMALPIIKAKIPLFAGEAFYLGNTHFSNNRLFVLVFSR